MALSHGFQMVPLLVPSCSKIFIPQLELAQFLLTSLSSAEALHAEGAFEATDVTPAVRLNDATDIWGFRGAAYRGRAAMPFRTARLDQARRCAALGLYAVTFYNDRDLDVATLTAYRDFRRRAGEVGMAHFLEVFNPAFAIDTGDTDLGAFINDASVRCLARRMAVTPCCLDQHPTHMAVAGLGDRALAAPEAPGECVLRRWSGDILFTPGRVGPAQDPHPGASRRPSPQGGGDEASSPSP